MSYRDQQGISPSAGILASHAAEFSPPGLTQLFILFAIRATLRQTVFPTQLRKDIPQGSGLSFFLLLFKVPIQNHTEVGLMK